MEPSDKQAKVIDYFAGILKVMCSEQPAHEKEALMLDFGIWLQSIYPSERPAEIPDKFSDVSTEPEDCNAIDFSALSQIYSHAQQLKLSDHEHDHSRSEQLSCAFQVFCTLLQNEEVVSDKLCEAGFRNNPDDARKILQSPHYDPKKDNIAKIAKKVIDDEALSLKNSLQAFSLNMKRKVCVLTRLKDKKFTRKLMSNSEGIKKINGILDQLNDDKISSFDALANIKRIAQSRLNYTTNLWAQSRFFGNGRHKNVHQLYKDLASLDLKDSSAYQGQLSTIIQSLKLDDSPLLHGHSFQYRAS